MQLTITLKDKSNLLSAFKSAPAIAFDEFHKSLERIAVTVVSAAQHNALVGKAYSGGGNLRQSIQYRPSGTTGYIVTVNAAYGVFVDQGTQPHVILPRNKSFLAFQDASGKWIFAKRVNHPGTRATHFFTDAVAEGERFANTEMQASLERVATRITNGGI